MSPDRLADEVWRSLTALVHDNRESWKRAVVEQTGLPFSRVRILRRLAAQPLTLKEVAHAALMDAPAATVAVNDLEERGLAVRQIDPANRRSKLVSLTDEGRAAVAGIDAIDDPAPAVLAGLDRADLEALRAILGKLAR